MRVQTKLRNLGKAKFPSGNNDFDKLVNIVADVYQVDSGLIVGGCRLREITTPRNIVAYLWHRGNSQVNTARLLGWKSPQNVVWACDRVAVIMRDPAQAWRMAQIVERLEADLPYLVLPSLDGN